MSEVRSCKTCKNVLPKAEGLKFCPFCGVVVQHSVTDKSAVKNSGSELPFKEYDHYIAVLKSCVNKDRLIEKLSKVLFRSMVAVRMAVEKIPCIIVYKSKANDMPPLVRTLDEEHATYVILGHDYDVTQKIDQIFTQFYSLPKFAQELLCAVPIQLWWGDGNYHVFADVRRENLPGILVVNDTAAYFVARSPSNFSNASWLVMPYNTLTSIDYTADVQGYALVLQQSDSRRVLFTFSNAIDTHRAHDLIKKAKQGAFYETLLQCSCSNCDHRFKAFANTLSGKENCSSCGSKMHYKLLKLRG